MTPPRAADELSEGRLLPATSILDAAGARPAHRRDRHVPRRVLGTAGGPPRRLANLREPPNGGHQLVELPVGCGPSPLTASATQCRTWASSHAHGALFEGGLDGGDLGQDVDAV